MLRRTCAGDEARRSRTATGGEHCGVSVCCDIDSDGVIERLAVGENAGTEAEEPSLNACVGEEARLSQATCIGVACAGEEARLSQATCVGVTSRPITDELNVRFKCEVEEEDVIASIARCCAGGEEPRFCRELTVGDEPRR